MKKLTSTLPALFFVAFALFSCKTSKDATNPKDMVTEVPTEESEIVTSEIPSTSQDPTNGRTFFASIERTPCFGRCPTYTMKIYSDGFIEYNGKRDVDMIGAYTTTISSEQMDAILEKAKEIKFFEMDDSYDGMITDLPSTTTKIVMNDTEKSVYRRHGYPKRILTLEQLFDDLLKSERWISESGEVYPPEH